MNESSKNASTQAAAGVPSRSQTGAPRLSTTPYNPGLQRLVDGKQAWAVPLDAAAKASGFAGWHQRGYLPHYDAPGVTQFVTLRLADSLPASRRGEWEQLLRIEESRAGVSNGAPACSRLSGANNALSRSQTGAPTGAPEIAPQAASAGRERRRRLEEYLDRGLGECWLRQPVIAQLTEDALRFFDGQRYRLAAWVIMPNHAHLLVDVWETPLAKLVKSWKSFTAREANRLLGRGGNFWEREYLDTVIKDEEHRQTAVRYIENNPAKAGLVLNPKDWPWSSARWRDEYGALKCSETQSRSQTGAPERRFLIGLNRGQPAMRETN